MCNESVEPTKTDSHTGMICVCDGGDGINGWSGNGGGGGGGGIIIGGSGGTWFE